MTRLVLAFRMTHLALTFKMTPLVKSPTHPAINYHKTKIHILMENGKQYPQNNTTKINTPKIQANSLSKIKFIRNKY